MLLFQLMKRKMSTSAFKPQCPKITLSPVETQITSLLNDYTNHYNSVNTPQQPLQLRITGGWVRDKLLGHMSNDLDIAINILSGQTFAENLQEYLEKNPQYGINPSGIHTIEKNPEKSKHLETATTKLYGLDIDFVNLRSEEYTEDSRIPVMQFGTPEQDAMRRDATLNALFYNIQEHKVEDLTKRGLQDLKNGILRTPLEPRKTFLDDPLRVLRLIRFASRFGFTLDEETFEAMKGEEVKTSLLEKISRERVGVEIAKTLMSDPTKGLELLCEADLIGVVFNFGALEKDIRSFNDSSLISQIENDISNNTLRSVNAIKSFQYGGKLRSVVANVLNEYKKLFWAGVVVEPWGSLKVVFNKKGKEMFACDAILKEGVKFSKHDAECVTKIVSTTKEFQRIVKHLPELKRSELGLFLRHYGDKFELSFVFNLLNEAIHGTESEIVTKYEQFYDLVIVEGLQETYKLRPLIDGKTLCSKLERKPGPWMSKIMDQILTWQLDNPTKSEDDCLGYVKTIIEQ
jgi:tRNA nucleotidyltransferase (CCA-adding enzyme)